jgi:large subunit ribosomal protein L13
MDDKIYYRHTGYSGGLKETKLKHLLDKKPTLPLEKAISGMIPQNRLKDDIMKKLKLFTGSEHPHEAQSPEPLSI